LTRLVNDGLLTTRQQGRRSFYGVAPDAHVVFAQADQRIYHRSHDAWDGSWTIVVIDANEATPQARSRLRQELAWAGLGTVAPNVMASPIVPASVAAGVVAHVGGFDHVLVSRSEVVEGPGMLDADELARRAAPLDDVADRYRAFVDRFEQFGDADLIALSPADSFKLRTLLVASFRRIALADPSLPEPLLPADWIGLRARRLVAAIYRLVVERAERFLLDVADPPLASSAADPDRFTP
jgi:phenylacetic acid degradation operon negative regulatory protein